MKVLSLYDGMACGMLAMQRAGITVEGYYAYEIDKYAVKTAQHNFPSIQELGDVFKEDYTKYKGQIDYLIGGSPCTYWSIAQSPDKRETTSSGVGWDLFSQYVRALHEAEPKFFVYENNKSMAKAIRESITQTFGFEPICINSALVSAQNRQRLYWVGKRNADGTYSKVDVQQPEDRGILLRDVLDGVTDREKGRAVIGSTGRTTEREYFKKFQGNMVYEPVNTTTDGKAQCLRATCYKDGIRNIVGNTVDRNTGVAEPVGTTKDGKAFALTSYYSTGQNAPHTLTKHIGSMVAEIVDTSDISPIKVGEVGNGGQGNGIYSVEGKSITQQANSGGLGSNTGLYAVPIGKAEESKTIVAGMQEIANSKGYIPEMFNAYNKSEITDKSPTLTTGSMATSSCAVNIFTPIHKCIAYAVEFDERGNPIKAVSAADGKTYTVYNVQNGQITIKGKTYPIKLCDGYYIIRKLTVSECKRLQTVPEWYEFPVSDTQAYKMLGNGWTVEVIAHLINATKNT